METLGQAMARIKAAAPLADYCSGTLQPRPQDGPQRYACPSPTCMSGKSGRQGSDTAFHLYTNPRGELRFKCQSCGIEGDVFDLAGIVNQTDSRAEQCNIVASFFGLEGTGGGNQDTQLLKATPVAPAKVQEADYTEGRAKAREYIAQAQARIDNPRAVAYLASRGISLEDARAWGLGYDPNAGGGKREDGTWCERGGIVIPWAGAEWYYITRIMAEDVASGKYQKPRTKDVGPQPLWNGGAVEAPAFYVVEGALDALAVMACGFEAIAMGTATKTVDLIEAMQGVEYAGIALLLSDNDRAGFEAQQAMSKEIQAAGLRCKAVSSCLGTAKDAAESFARSHDGLATILKEQYTWAVNEAHAAELAELGAFDTGEVAKGLYEMQDVLEPIPTGLESIDKAIGGGLPAQGLCVIGAVSSVGKTTLVVQVADYIASTGRPVLFCSIEQGRAEIAAKSLARIMAGMGRSNGSSMFVSAQAIMNRAERERWQREDAEKAAAFEQACRRYYWDTHKRDKTPTLYLMEPQTPPTVEDVRRVAEAIRRRHGVSPVVAVDYAQLLAAPSGLERGTDKQVMDANTLGLRLMARSMATCVIAISSINRASYNDSISLESFKETGLLEYSADLLLALQPQGLQNALLGKSADSGATKAQAKRRMLEYKVADIKALEVLVLKNRNGSVGKNATLEFDGLASKFTSVEGGAAQTIGGRQVVRK